jgi:hypothetical protein
MVLMGEKREMREKGEIEKIVLTVVLVVVVVMLSAVLVVVVAVEEGR